MQLIVRFQSFQIYRFEINCFFMCRISCWCIMELIMKEVGHHMIFIDDCTKIDARAVDDWRLCCFIQSFPQAWYLVAILRLQNRFDSVPPQ